MNRTRVINNNPGVNYLRFARSLTAYLPVSKEIKTIFNFGFDYIIQKVANKDYYTGAMSMFAITPASLLYNSPLLAKSTAGYSFPGYPVAVKWLTIKIQNVTKLSERLGRWCAVFIPYLEIHDSKHYVTKLASMSYEDVVAMPHAKMAPAYQDIILNYRMNDRTAYCARPRELSEEIGIVVIMWNALALDKYEQEFQPSTFECEVEVIGGVKPHVIFGPKHRTDYPEKTFNVVSKTGDSCQIFRGAEYLYTIPYDAYLKEKAEGSNTPDVEFETLDI